MIVIIVRPSCVGAEKRKSILLADGQARIRCVQEGQHVQRETGTGRAVTQRGINTRIVMNDYGTIVHLDCT